MALLILLFLFFLQVIHIYFAHYYFYGLKKQKKLHDVFVLNSYA